MTIIRFTNCHKAPDMYYIYIYILCILVYECTSYFPIYHIYNHDYHHSIDSHPESFLVSIDVSWIIISRIIFQNIIIPYSLSFHIHWYSVSILFPCSHDFSRRASIGGLAAGCHRTNAIDGVMQIPELWSFNGSLSWLVVVFYVVW